MFAKDDEANASKAFVETFVIEPKGSGPLDGLKFAVKDLMDVAGHKTSCGNPGWRDSHPVAVANAVCVDQLLYAGATCVGKTVTDELAFGLNGENFFYGTPLNPRAPNRIPGGSSCGSASAVACGLADFALGTDTGGSVRAPASNCGLFGIRPSYGSISVAGVNPLAPSFDTVGVLARSSDVLSKAVSVLLGCSVPSPVNIGTIHVLTEAFEMSDAEVQDALSSLIDSLRRMFPGKVRDASVRAFDPDSTGEPLQDWYRTYRTIQWAEIWSCLGAWVEATKPEFGPRTSANFELTRNLDRKEIGGAIARREIYVARLREYLGRHDLLCMPTMPSIAPVKESLGLDRTTGSYYPRSLSMTSVASMGRVPQVTLPLAHVNGVPIGLSLLSAEGTDAFLLAAAEMIAEELIEPS
jgi:amidase